MPSSLFILVRYFFTFMSCSRSDQNISLLLLLLLLLFPFLPSFGSALRASNIFAHNKKK